MIRARHTNLGVVQIAHYPVRGSNLDEIYASIQQDTPIPGGYAGKTSLVGKVGANEQSLFGLVTIKREIVFEYRIEVLLPTLDGPPSDKWALQCWVRFYRGIRGHEMNHVSMYQAAARRMLDLGDSQRFSEVTEVAERLSNEYDVVSAHGTLEGSVLGESASTQNFGEWLQAAISRINAFS